MNSISSSSSAPTNRSMSKEQAGHLQKLARFFFLVTLDEELALFYTRRAINEFLKKSDSVEERLSERVLVQVCYFTLKKLWAAQGANPTQNFTVSYERGWKFKKTVDLSRWAIFRGRAEADEFATVVFCKALGLPETSVAHALNISLGTLRFRLARGLRTLGQSREVSV